MASDTVRVKDVVKAVLVEVEPPIEDGVHTDGRMFVAAGYFKRSAAAQEPRYFTEGAVAFDLSASEDVAIEPGEVRLVPTGLVLALPQGYHLHLHARSSLALRTGLILANGVGVVDEDYNGSADEIRVMFANIGRRTQLVKAGDRVAQGIVTATVIARFQPFVPDAASRGGFWSTGGYQE